ARRRVGDGTRTDPTGGNHIQHRGDPYRTRSARLRKERVHVWEGPAFSASPRVPGGEPLRPSGLLGGSGRAVGLLQSSGPDRRQRVSVEPRGDLELAVSAAREAGEALMRRFGGAHEVTYKEPDQPLTAADLEADEILRARLLGARPEYGWLSEETKDAPDRLRRERVWIVDPLDGTRSYIAGRPEFAVSIGLVEAG